MAGLSEPVRTFYEVRFRRGLSQADTAAEMGVTRRKVRTWEEHVVAGLYAHLSAVGLADPLGERR